MSDYSTHVSLSRNQIAHMLTDDVEQTPYVLAEVASSARRGTITFDDFVDCMAALDDDQKDALKMFCAAIVETLSDA